MHLAVVSPFPPEISGVGQYGWHIVHGLAATGRFDRLTVLANADGPAPEPISAAPPIDIVRAWRRDDLGTAARLTRSIRAQRPDAIWFNAGLTMFGSSRLVNFLGLVTPALARASGVPVLTTLHETVARAPLARLGLANGRTTLLGAHLAMRLLLQSNQVIVTLRQSAQLLERDYHARHILHVPHGAFSPVKHLPFPSGGPPQDLLFFTSHAPHRGLDVLIAAFRAVRARQPSATLTIAGGDHPRFLGFSERRRAALDSETGLRWLGPQPEAGLRALFAQARVVVLPYLATSGASSVLYRAAALGRPVIASDLPEMRASAEEAGLRVDLVPPGDAGQLAAALEGLLCAPERQHALAEHNLAAMRSMSLEHTSRRYADLLARLAA